MSGRIVGYNVDDVDVFGSRDTMKHMMGVPGGLKFTDVIFGRIRILC
jgi:hypothetical protein